MFLLEKKENGNDHESQDDSQPLVENTQNKNPQNFCLSLLATQATIHGNDRRLR